VTYFSVLRAPMLVGCDVSLRSRHMTETIFGGRAAPVRPESLRLLTGYLLVVDKAVREYRAGCRALVDYSHSDNESSLLADGLGRFETCIHSIVRALRFLAALKQYRESPTIERGLRRKIEAIEESIRPIRDAIEHIESDIAEPGLMPVGAAHILAINHAGDTLDISVHKISFVELASAVEQLFAAGSGLIDALPAPDLNSEQSSQPQMRP
jgi:hypothetical protein